VHFYDQLGLFPPTRLGSSLSPPAFIVSGLFLLFRQHLVCMHWFLSLGTLADTQYFDARLVGHLPMMYLVVFYPSYGYTTRLKDCKIVMCIGNSPHPQISCNAEPPAFASSSTTSSYSLFFPLGKQAGRHVDPNVVHAFSFGQAS
jgi:hypothetical protein